MPFPAFSCKIAFGQGKPIAINQHIGRRPVAAFGNSDGDLQMLQWTTGGDGPSFALYVHHTDAEPSSVCWDESEEEGTNGSRKGG